MRAAAGPGVVAITAGNYGGKLGKFHFRLHEVLGKDEDELGTRTRNSELGTRNSELGSMYRSRPDVTSFFCLHPSAFILPVTCSSDQT